MRLLSVAGRKEESSVLPIRGLLLAGGSLPFEWFRSALSGVLANKIWIFHVPFIGKASIIALTYGFDDAEWLSQLNINFSLWGQMVAMFLKMSSWKAKNRFQEKLVMWNELYSQKTFRNLYLFRQHLRKSHSPKYYNSPPRGCLIICFSALNRRDGVLRVFLWYFFTLRRIFRVVLLNVCNKQDNPFVNIILEVRCTRDDKVSLLL